jgi:5-amino-6-(5-phospho-D-ribitylamino)uracil phosphatase
VLKSRRKPILDLHSIEGVASVRPRSDGGGVKFKMIAIDLDGTLLSPKGEVTPRTRAAVQRVLEAGFLVCFATGRNFTESRAVLDAVGHYDSAVFVGGAIVIDTKRHATLHRTLMDPQLARQVSQFFESRGHAVLAMQDTGSAGVDYLISKQMPLTEATKQWLSLTHATVHWIDDLSHHDHPHTIRAGIVAEIALAGTIETELRQQFGSKIVSHSIVVPAFGVHVVEVFDPAVNKWEGILQVAKQHNIDPKQIIAIGDDINDLPMVQCAGLGVAMGNANPQLQAVARRVIGHNRDDGLALFLEELVAEASAN